MVGTWVKFELLGWHIKHTVVVLLHTVVTDNWGLLMKAITYAADRFKYQWAHVHLTGGQLKYHVYLLGSTEDSEHSTARHDKMRGHSAPQTAKRFKGSKTTSRMSPNDDLGCSGSKSTVTPVNEQSAGETPNLPPLIDAWWRNCTKDEYLSRESGFSPIITDTCDSLMLAYAYAKTSFSGPRPVHLHWQIFPSQVCPVDASQMLG